MQFGFVPGRGTTDTIAIVRQLQEKSIATNEPTKLWCRGMGCACHSEHALQCPEPCAGQWSVQWGVCRQHEEERVPGFRLWSWCPQEIWQAPLCCLPQWVGSNSIEYSQLSAIWGSTRGAAASLVADQFWWPTKSCLFHMSRQCSTPRRQINDSTQVWPKWMSMAPCLMWRPLSATWVTCYAQVGAATVQLLSDVAWPGESSENSYLFSPPGTSRLIRRTARCNYTACVRSILLHSETCGSNASYL